MYKRQTFYTTEGESLTVSFQSNLASTDPEGDPISVKLYKGQDELSGNDLVYETTVERTAKTVTLPGEYLTEISAGDTPSYTLVLSAEVDIEATVTRTAIGYVVVRAQPAVVKLTGLDHTTLPAGGSVTFGWTVDHLDPVNSNNAFELLITREGTELHKETDTVAAESGSYTLDLSLIHI